MRRLLGAGVSSILLPTIALSLTSARPATAAVQRWSPTGSLATAREGHTATLLPDGRVLVAGGFDGQIYLASAEIYDPASGTWSPTGSMATARDQHTATRLPDGRVLVAGGYSSSGHLASADIGRASGRSCPTAALGAAPVGH